MNSVFLVRWFPYLESLLQYTYMQIGCWFSSLPNDGLCMGLGGGGVALYILAQHG